MANFKSDAQGFLVGEKLLDFTQELVRGQNRAMPVWREIRNDVRSIARQLGVQVAAARRSGQVATSQPAGRNASAASSPRAQVTPMAQRERATRQPAALPQRDNRGRFVASPVAAAVDEALRDRRGRFTGGGGDKGEGGGKSDPKAPGAISRSLAKVADRLGQVGAGLGNQTDNLDPTLNAAKEVRETIAPLGRGLYGLFGRNAERKKERAKERWYKKMWLQLTSPAFGKRRQAAEGARGGGSWLGGLFGNAGGMLGGLAARLPALLGIVLSRVFLPVAALWASFKLGQWIGEKINTWLEESGMQAKLFDAVDWIKDTVSSAWGTVTQKAGDAWARVTDTFAEGVKTLTTLPEKINGLFSSVDKAFRNIPVIGEAYGKAADALKATAADVKKGYDEKKAGSTAPAATVAQAVGGTVAQAQERVASAGRNALNTVGSMLGISRVVETGAGYNVVQRGDGSLVRQEGARNWRNNNPGNIEFKPWMAEKYGATSDGRFAIFPTYEAGRQAKSDLIFEGKNYRDLSLSSAIARYAPPNENNTKGYQAAVLAAAGGVDKRMGDYSQPERSAIMDAMQKVEGFRVGTVTPWGARSGAKVGMPGLPGATAAGVPLLNAADLPRPVEIKDMPTRLNSDRGQAGGKVTVKLPEGMGQDVSDRGLAHIVTGGIGGA